MEEKTIDSFFMSLYNDAIIFSRDKFDEKLKSTEYIDDDSFLKSVIYKINDIIKRQDYPKFAIENLGKMVEYISKKYKDNNYIEKINIQYDKLLDINSNDVYAYEAMVKFCGLDCALLDEMDIDCELIEQSIIFDFIAFKDLKMGNDNIEKNYLYIASLKKFFLEFPEMFLDKTINQNARKILELHMDDIEAKRLMYKLKHIDKFINNNFDYLKFKSLVDYIVIQAMLVNSKQYDLNKKLVGRDKIETLYTMIEKNLLYEPKMRRNALEIMSNYKNDIILSLPKEEKEHELFIYNNMLGKLNTYDDKKSILIESECVKRLDNIGKFKSMFIPIEIEQLIQNDLLVMIYLLTEKEKKEKGKQIDYSNVYSSINKFYNIVPEIFDNPEIYERTMKLLSKKDIHTMITKNKIKSIYKR